MPGRGFCVVLDGKCKERIVMNFLIRSFLLNEIERYEGSLI